MFCSTNFTSNATEEGSTLIGLCAAELANVTCFASNIYVLILLLIYVKWLPNIELEAVTRKKLFYGHNTRHTVILLLLISHFIEFGNFILEDVQIWFSRFVPILACISTMVCQIFYNKLEHHRKYHYLGITTIYWLCCGSCRILLFLNAAKINLDFSHIRYTISFTTAVLCYLLGLNDFISIIKETRKDRISHEDEVHEDMCAYKHPFCHWYSKITFYWLTPMLHVGYMTTLGPAHFGSLPEWEKSAVQTHLLQNLYFSQKKNPRRKMINLWRCFLIGYGKTFIFGGFLKLIGDTVGLIPPLGISVVVRYIETEQEVKKSTMVDNKLYFIEWREFLGNGYIMATIVFVTIIAQGTLSQNSTHVINVEGIRLKNALQGLIYKKLLKIRKNGLNKDNDICDNVGYITNLTTEDAYNIMACFWIANYIWAIPLKITILIYLLYREIGITSVISSVGCIIVLLVLQFVIGKKMSQNYKKISDWSDKRLRKINEILQGIRLIKLCGWETDFISEVSDLRKNELKKLNLDSTYWTIITFLANTSSVIIAVTTLTLHHRLENTSISLGTLFTSLALFNQLTVPLFIFPVMLPIVVSALVSIKRIEAFLSLPEIKNSRRKFNRTTNKKKVTGKPTSGENPKIEVEFADQKIRLRKITENSENEEENKIAASESTNDFEILKIENLVCSWDESMKTLLSLENITMNSGSLNVIIGKKGSGKTSFLHALLGELIQCSGKTEWQNKLFKIGYVPQSPWLLNDSLKQNIVFGYPFHEKQFLRVLEICALKSDVNAMPKKECTIIGDRGVTLSGGQKQRIMIARMLYSNPDIMIMDDPFSSLDSKITNYIFENGIKKYMTKRNKIVIMTTNYKKFLSHADQIIIMENCKLKVAGPFADVSKIAFREIRGLDECTEGGNAYDGRAGANNEKAQGSNTFVPLKRRRSTMSGSRYFAHDLLLPTDDCDVAQDTLLRKPRRSRAATVTEYPNSPSLHRNVFRVSSLQTNHNTRYLKKRIQYGAEDGIIFGSRQSIVSISDDDFENCNEKLLDLPNGVCSWDVVDDDQTNGQGQTISETKIFLIFTKSSGLFVVFLYICSTCVWQIFRVMADFWLSHIISVANENAKRTEEMNKDCGWCLHSYVLLSSIALTFSIFSISMGQYAGSISRKILHKKLLNNILKCSVQFFDGTPFGQIMNHFSTDIEVIDKKISTSSQRLIQFQLLCMSAILVNCIITPWFIIMIFPLALIYYMIQRFYRGCSRELQRLENVLKVPVTNHFLETFAGLEVIRASDRENSFSRALFQKMDAHTNVFLILNSTNRWLGIALDYLGGIVVFAAMLVSLISVAMKPNLKTSPFFGLAINYTLLIPIYLTWVVKFLNDLEIYLGSVDRIENYSKIPTENYNIEASVPDKWPQRGSIKFQNVTLRYGAQERYVIQNLNLQIHSGQKVGICGQTGSGKSSLMMSLFKMIPFVEGIITIDEVNINNVPIQWLRTRISIVPQDTILFGGNIRKNLDPRGEFTDEELWHSLKLVKIHETIAKIGGLDARVQDGGINLSVGEKQLICLARAILRDTPCLFLDEATNSLQPEAEMEFLKLALEIFQNRTVVVITHRVTSLLNFDRILVMCNGTLVEDGVPRELLSNTSSKFHNLVKTAQQLPRDTLRF